MRCPRCDRWPDEGQELCRFCIAEDQAPSESEGSNCPGVHDQLHVDAMDVAADSAEIAGARKHEGAVSSKFSREPSMGTGTGSEVIDVVREGESQYRVTTKNGRQEVIKEAILKMLPQGGARLLTLQTRERR